MAAPEHEELISSVEVDRTECFSCPSDSISKWRKRTIYRDRETVTLFYCTVCGEFQWGYRGVPTPAATKPLPD